MACPKKYRTSRSELELAKSKLGLFPADDLSTAIDKLLSEKMDLQVHVAELKKLKPPVAVLQEPVKFDPTSALLKLLNAKEVQSQVLQKQVKALKKQVDLQKRLERVESALALYMQASYGEGNSRTSIKPGQSEIDALLETVEEWSKEAQE